MKNLSLSVYLYYFNFMTQSENKYIRKVVGKEKKNQILSRVYQLTQFLKKQGLYTRNEGNIRPIRKIVGRPRAEQD